MGRRARARLAAVKIFVLGAGQVGSAVVEALHEEHEVTVLDVDVRRLQALAYRFDIVTAVGNGASRRVLRDAGAAACDLLIACTSRDEVNVVASMFAKKLSERVRTIVRTTSVEYLEIWREQGILPYTPFDPRSPLKDLSGLKVVAGEAPPEQCGPAQE